MSRTVCGLLAGLLVTFPLYAADGMADLLSAEIAKFQVNSNLEKAMASLSSAGKVKILPDWQALAAAGVRPTTPVAIRARGETLEKLLDTLVLRAAKDAPLAWYVDGEAIRITTKDNVTYHRAPSPDAAVAALPEAPAEPKAAPGDADARPADKTPSPREVIRASTNREVSFKEMALKDVIRFFQAQTGLNVVVNWSSLEAVGIAKDTPVSVEAHNLSAGRVLDLVLDNISGSRDKFERVYYVIDDGVVTIATGNALNTKTKSMVMDISDLLMVVPNFKGPRLELVTNNNNNNNTGTGTGVDTGTNNTNNNTNNNETTTNEPTMAEQRAQVQENLITAIKNSIGEEMWQPDGKGSITIFQGKLVITQTLLGFKLMDSSVK